mmetsp:Transcript_29262/g.52964  ORF Transcript_29262/g.52964 Transcript_29262/m.52964 type:complete len:300 (+) Transcript_29262:557-1456(+)
MRSPFGLYAMQRLGISSGAMFMSVCLCASHTRKVASSPAVAYFGKNGCADKAWTSSPVWLCPCTSGPPPSFKLSPLPPPISKISAPKVPTTTLLLSFSHCTLRTTGHTLPKVAKSTQVKVSSTVLNTFRIPSAPPVAHPSLFEEMTLTGPVWAGTLRSRVVPANTYKDPSWHPTTVRFPTNPRLKNVCHCPTAPNVALFHVMLCPSIFQKRMKLVPHCTRPSLVVGGNCRSKVFSFGVGLWHRTTWFAQSYTTRVCWSSRPKDESHFPSGLKLKWLTPRRCCPWRVTLVGHAPPSGAAS